MYEEMKMYEAMMNKWDNEVQKLAGEHQHFSILNGQIKSLIDYLSNLAEFLDKNGSFISYNIKINHISFDDWALKNHSRKIYTILNNVNNLKNECAEKLSELIKLKRAALRNYNNAKAEYDRLNAAIAAASIVTPQNDLKQETQQIINNKVRSRGNISFN